MGAAVGKGGGVGIGEEKVVNIPLSVLEVGEGGRGDEYTIISSWRAEGGRGTCQIYNFLFWEGGRGGEYTIVSSWSGEGGRGDNYITLCLLRQRGRGCEYTTVSSWSGGGLKRW